MIPATKSWWAELLFRPYLNWIARKEFSGVHLQGTLPQLNPELPLLLLPNHSTWWDGFFVYLLNRRIFKRELYLMMLESQLSTYRFFRRLGAFSVKADSPRDLQRSLNYSVELLKNNSSRSTVLCLFPQGELTLWDARPLNYKGGVEWILSQYGERVNLLPLAIKIEQTGHRHPEAFFLFDECHTVSPGNFPGIGWLENRATDLLTRMRRRILHGERGYGLLDVIPEETAPASRSNEPHWIGSYS